LSANAAGAASPDVRTTASATTSRCIERLLSGLSFASRALAAELARFENVAYATSH
jgi:hypothetical protein